MTLNRLATAGAATVALIGVLVSPNAPAAKPAQAAAARGGSSVVGVVPAAYTPNVKNGIVFSVTQVGSSVVIGGSFTSVASHDGTVTAPSRLVTAFTAGTGKLVTSFAPDIVGSAVTSVIPGPTANTVYVGGAISSVDGVKTHVALLNATTGAIVPGWRAVSLNGAVNELALTNGQLLVAGDFSSAGGATRQRFASLNAATGALTNYAVVDFAGHHNFGVNPGTADGAVGVKFVALNPAGTRLVVTGNFTRASDASGTASRDQIAMLDLGASKATIDRSWATAAFTSPCNTHSFDSYIRDASFAPDGSYFVVAATGGARTKTNSDGSRGLCDSASEFDPNAHGTDVAPTWVDYTGRDTLWTATATASAVYVGGHERWLNNTHGQDNATEGAVPRPSIAALDPVNGLPLAWNPGRNPRGGGTHAMFLTSDGLYVGGDQDFVGNFKYLRQKIAFFPLAGGQALASNTANALPGNVYLLGGSSTSSARSVRYDGTSAPGTPTQDASVNWSSARGAFEINDQVYYGSTDGHFYRRSFNGSSFGPQVVIDPYDDPVWSNIQTGSGQTYRGVASSFYSRLHALTSMFFRSGRLYYTVSGNSSMFWRWFEPDSGIVGADEFTTHDGHSWNHVAGAFLNGKTLYYADSASHDLLKIGFTGGRPTGTPTLADSSIDWTSHGAFVSRGATTTALGIAPAGQARQHQVVTLTATVTLDSRAGVHPPGVVTFTDGDTRLGRAPVNTRTGRAVLATKKAPPSAPLGAGLTASFTPSDPTFAASTSATVAYTVDPVAAIPLLAGKARVGRTDTCVENAPATETISYAWKVGRRQVGTGDRFTVPVSAFRRNLVCVATVSQGGGPRDSARSEARTVARGRPLQSVRAPRLSGAHRVGTRERATHGAWSPQAATYTYQWYLGAAKIPGATRRSLRLTATDRGRRIRCRVTAQLTGYHSGVAFSRRVTVTK
jgi:hypothetical protein